MEAQTSSPQRDPAIDEPAAAMPIVAVHGLVELGVDGAQTCSDEACFVGHGGVDAD